MSKHVVVLGAGFGGLELMATTSSGHPDRWLSRPGPHASHMIGDPLRCRFGGIASVWASQREVIAMDEKRQRGGGPA